MLRHPLTLLTREVPPISLQPGSTWLLVQDLHAPFADLDQGALAVMAARKVVGREFDEFAETLRLVAANVARLVAAARAHRLGVVYSCLGYESGATPSAFQEATGWRWQVAGIETEFPPGWQPLPEERVFSKPGWGALANPAFVRFLEDRRVENLIVVGAMLDFGIRQTCYELADRGLGSLVISDAVAPLTLGAQAHTTGNLAHGLTKLRSTAELLDLLAVMRTEGPVLV
ncbi:MAG: isochorismatase family protein [Chloroflexia bacterium]|nr:isochorismatase family protein [Chloroflexia bacterium]